MVYSVVILILNNGHYDGGDTDIIIRSLGHPHRYTLRRTVEPAGVDKYRFHILRKLAKINGRQKPSLIPGASPSSPAAGHGVRGRPPPAGRGSADHGSFPAGGPAHGAGYSPADPLPLCFKERQARLPTRQPRQRHDYSALRGHPQADVAAAWPSSQQDFPEFSVNMDPFFHDSEVSKENSPSI